MYDLSKDIHGWNQMAYLTMTFRLLRIVF